MKVLITYTETQYFSTEREVEMTAKEYADFCKMSDFNREEKLNFCALDLGSHDYTESRYEFQKI